MQPNEYQREALRTENTPEFININTAKAMEPQVTHNERGTKHSLDADAIGAAVEKDLQLSRLMHAALGMCTETGEAQDMIKKHVIYGKPLDLVNLVEEVGDALWYMAIALDAVGVSFEDCMQRNITKLRLRYPDKFSAERALNRDLVAERQALEGSSDIADRNPIRR